MIWLTHSATVRILSACSRYSFSRSGLAEPELDIGDNVHVVENIVTGKNKRMEADGSKGKVIRREIDNEDGSKLLEQEFIPNSGKIFHSVVEVSSGNDGHPVTLTTKHY